MGDKTLCTLLVCLLAFVFIVDGLKIHSLEKKLKGRLEATEYRTHTFIQTNVNSEVSSSTEASSAAPDLNTIERSVFNWWKNVANIGPAPGECDSEATGTIIHFTQLTHMRRLSQCGPSLGVFHPASRN